MKIAVIHGYLLSGTGSNIYVANLIAGLVARGHDVFLFCQEPKPEDLPFIDECYDFEADNRRFFQVFKRRGIGPGRARLFRPRIGEILPVYVLDEYVGFTAKEFQLLADLKIEDYVARNAQAVRTVHEAFGFEVVQANHLIASPAVARRALEKEAVPYHVTIHGSALNYSVKKRPRLSRLALYGLEKATTVTASSRFLGKQLNDYLTSLGRPRKRVKVIYPGVELSLFRTDDEPFKNVISLAEEVQEKAGKGKGAGLKEALRVAATSNDIVKYKQEITEPAVYDRHAPDRDVPEALRQIAWGQEKVVVFVGKYLAAKGLHAYILAAPMIRAHFAGTRFLAVGFSDQRELFEALVAALAEGEGDLICDLVCEIEARCPVPVGQQYLAELKRQGNFADYVQMAQTADLEESILFTGLLSHEELSQLLPAVDLSVSPSIFPEAFGMVAVEALASGIFPLVTEDFGMAEIAAICRKHLGDKIPELPRLKLDNRFIMRLQEAVIMALSEPALKSRRFKNAAHKLAAQVFGWNRVVDDYLELFAGRQRRAV